MDVESKNLWNSKTLRILLRRKNLWPWPKGFFFGYRNPGDSERESICPETHYIQPGQQ